MKYFRKLTSKIFLGTLALTSVLISCKKDFLEVAPTQSISSTEAFTTEPKLQAAMTGIYDLLTSSAFTYNIILNAEAKGEDTYPNSTGNYSRFVNGYQYVETVNNGELQSHWSIGYRIIANCNQLIENVPAAPVTDAVKKRYIAEATAVRAYVHFQLVREFGEKSFVLDPEAMGVPVVEKSIGPNDEFPARAKVKDVYASILKDLLFAETNFPTTLKDVYRININSIKAIEARVYLTMGNWAKASELAKASRAPYALSSGSALLEGFRLPTPEWIWALRSTADDNSFFLEVSSFYDPYDRGYSSFRVSKDLFASFATNDIRKNQFRIPATGGGDPTTGPPPSVSGDGYFTSKFVFDASGANDQLLIRASEMVLTEAEAEARIGGANELAAKNALLLIQRRANPAAVISANTGNALVAEILLERRKELFGEGHRYYDILRTKQSLVRVASAGHWSVLNIPAGDKKFALPIPQAEINANPKVVQNPL
ncbi:RagB/SusD family nutrient uptake outer membrane protein [Daejeonella sp.]|uniref:RagB/SusD family nutrient uptake outer membrane protein n=1 Tax=Daejeonella sp. TaxID=2805397 RepID=UPI0030BCF779